VVEWLLLGLSLLLVAVCGVFVAGEFALLAADRASIEDAAERGDRRAAGVLDAFRSLSTQLSGVQVAITITNLAIGFLAEPALSGLLHGPLRAAGVGGETVEVVAVAVALAASTLATMLFGELVPKNVAISAPEAVARSVQAPVRAFTTVMRGPIRALNASADAVLRPFGLHTREELAAARTPDELLWLVRHSTAEGTLPPRTARLVVRSLTFGEKRAGEVMTPRTRMTTVDARASVTGFLTLARTSGHSRLPVTGHADPDEIVGIVELDAAVGVPYPHRPHTRVQQIMTAPVEVPESLSIDQVVRVLQQQHAQLAIVRDEYGGLAGLLTGEDLLEELVGEVDDEFDTTATAAARTAAGWEVSGLLRPDELLTATGLRLPDHGPYDTLGGLIMQRLGRIPVVGDQLVIGDVEISVLRMDRLRVDRALLSPVGQPPLTGEPGNPRRVAT
jgi:CBS domain containing-hemolysin-like protein